MAVRALLRKRLGEGDRIIRKRKTRELRGAVVEAS